MTFCDPNFTHWDHAPTCEPPKFCLLLIDRTCQCCVVGPSSYWNFPWPIISYSHGCLPPPPTPNVTKRENKSNNSVSHYSVCQHMVPISRVCVREGETPCECFIFHTYSPHIQSSLSVLFLHLLDSSFLSRPLASPNSVSMPTTLILRFKITLSLPPPLSLSFSLFSPSILGFAFLGCKSDLKQT